VIAIVPPVSIAAVIVMTLPFSLLMSVLPEESGEHEGGGRGSGVFGISRGIGLLLGPLLGALAIYGMQDVLSGTEGYGAIFLIAAAAVGLSALVVRRLPLDVDSAASEA
jgi:MFS family permease